MLLQIQSDLENVEGSGIIKNELVAILFALAAILFAAAYFLNWLHEKEQKRKLNNPNQITVNKKT